LVLRHDVINRPLVGLSSSFPSLVKYIIYYHKYIIYLSHTTCHWESISVWWLQYSDQSLTNLQQNTKQCTQHMERPVVHLAEKTSSRDRERERERERGRMRRKDRVVMWLTASAGSACQVVSSSVNKWRWCHHHRPSTTHITQLSVTQTITQTDWHSCAVILAAEVRLLALKQTNQHNRLTTKHRQYSFNRLDFPGSRKKFPIPGKKIPKWENLWKLHIIHLNKIPWIWKAATVDGRWAASSKRVISIVIPAGVCLLMRAHTVGISRQLTPINTDEWRSPLTLLHNCLWFNDPTSVRREILTNARPSTLDQWPVRQQVLFLSFFYEYLWPEADKQLCMCALINATVSLLPKFHGSYSKMWITNITLKTYCHLSQAFNSVEPFNKHTTTALITSTVIAWQNINTKHTTEHVTLHVELLGCLRQWCLSEYDQTM